MSFLKSNIFVEIITNLFVQIFVKIIRTTNKIYEYRMN